MRKAVKRRLGAERARVCLEELRVRHEAIRKLDNKIKAEKAERRKWELQRKNALKIERER